MRKILITAGPTREKIDPIRFITNSSTGKIGYLLAELARKKGFKVILITGPTFLRPPEGIKVICVESAKELKKEVLRYISQVDCLIMAAAVGDYRPLRIEQSKIKRKKELVLSLMRNPDILKEAGKRKKKRQVFVGFALETENFVKNGMQKIKEKNLDFLLVNSPGFFGEAKGKKIVKLIKRKGEIVELSTLSKRKIARRILNEIDGYLCK